MNFFEDKSCIFFMRNWSDSSSFVIIHRSFKSPFFVCLFVIVVVVFLFCFLLFFFFFGPFFFVTTLGEFPRLMRISCYIGELQVYNNIILRHFIKLSYVILKEKFSLNNFRTIHNIHSSYLERLTLYILRQIITLKNFFFFI